MRTGLLIVGVVLQVTGALLVGTVELWPPTRERLGRLARSLKGLAVRTRLWRSSTKFGAAHFSSEVRLSGSGMALRRPADETDEGKMVFLLEQANEIQRRVGRLENDQVKLQEHLDRSHEKLRHELNQAFDARVLKDKMLYIRARRLGVVFVAAGGVIQGLVSLIG